AVSQQIAALEALVGVPLFQCTPKGVVPSRRGQDLYSQIFDPLDKLERVSRSLAGRADAGDAAPIRLGAPSEYFQCFALERLAGANLPLIVSFGEEKDLLAQLESGGLDAVVSTVRPTQRTLQHQVLADKSYALIGPPALEIPAEVSHPEALGAWLNTRPWVSYSAELPITRRFWQHHLGRRFDAALSLVVPDLRAVLRAVELGYGVSILPGFLCREALRAGRVREVWPVRRLIPADQWVLAFREVDAERAAIRLLGARLAAREAPAADQAPDQ
ncbi:MAG TPA: LysR family transcriptional regulator, partial [Herpetosiphonaceae bacterium]|nr:LysR family transcriptional regulator [Herpetosiphonaceae bacterium]